MKNWFFFTLIMATLYATPSWAQSCDDATGLTYTVLSDTEVQLDWDAVPNATGYKLRVELESPGAPFELRLFVSTNSHTVADLTPGAVYKFKVRTQCGGDHASWSDNVFFSTTSAPPGGGGPGPASCTAPDGLAVSNLTDVSATLSWNAVPGATAYRVEVEDGDNTPPYHQETTLTGTSIDIDGLVAGGQYKFKVKAKCSSGNFSDYSPWFFFPGNPGGPGSGPCAMPAGLSVTDITDNSALVSWDPVPGVTTYELEVEDADNTPIFFLNELVNATEFLVTGLSTGGNYKFKVKSKCSGGNNSDWTEWFFFSTGSGGGPTGPCVTPTELAINDLTPTSVLVSWAVVSGAQAYELQVEDADNTPPFSINEILTATEFLMTGLSPSGNYKFKVKSKCSGGNNSDWSDWFFFSTPANFGAETALQAKGEQKAALDLQLFPNPVQLGAPITLKMTAAIDRQLNGYVQVFDLQGRLYLTREIDQSGSAELSIPSAGLSPGMYQVVFRSATDVQGQRFRIVE